MNLDKINELVSRIAKIVDSNEKLAIPVLSAKLRKVAEVHPYDQTVMSLATVFSKMDDNNKLFITKGEFKSLYNKFYTTNTRFAEYFQDELGNINNLVGPKFAEPTKPMIERTHESFSDPVLTNALASAFDKNISLKLYSEQMGSKAKFIVSNNLDAWNLKASKLSIEAGNQYFIIVKADYNTPKGITSIFIPVEINNEKVLDPQVFMCSAGPQELNHKNIKGYLTTYAGAPLKVQAASVLAVLTKEITKGDKVNDIDLAMTRIAATKERSADFGSIINQKVLDTQRNIEVSIPKVAEASSFAAKFSSASGIAEFSFGQDKINNGRNAIIRTLAEFGIKNPQISVMACDENTISYGVSLFGGRTAFRVPIKIANGKILSPEIIICNGSIGSFSKETITDLFVDSTIDGKVVAATSPQHSLSAAELVKNVKIAVNEANYSKAEDALNILQQSGNEAAYKEAFITYINGISKQGSRPSESTCSMIIESSNSSYPICGHTNLPLHKVYQDEHGNCAPLYRKGIAAANSEAYFMNAKILG